MITHLRGELTHIDPGELRAELAVGGVTYEVLVPAFLWPELQGEAGEANTDAEVGLYIYYHATEKLPVPVLVGFLRRAEREFFRKFTTVEGIGPVKAAKAMNLSVSTIARAVEQEDRSTLTRMPGIGARAADKIIAHLRGKVTAEAALQDGEIDQPVDVESLRQDRVVLDAVEAVAGLGYSRAEARRWVEEALAEDRELKTMEDVTLAVLRRQGSVQG